MMRSKAILPLLLNYLPSVCNCNLCGQAECTRSSHTVLPACAATHLEAPTPDCTGTPPAACALSACGHQGQAEEPECPSPNSCLFVPLHRLCVGSVSGVVVGGTLQPFHQSSCAKPRCVSRGDPECSCPDQVQDGQQSRRSR